MAAHPHDPEQPFNRLVDLADVRGWKIGLAVAPDLLRRRPSEEYRHLAAIELAVSVGTGHNIVRQPILNGDLQAAATRLLAPLLAP